jgi:uncharacterized membrane protein YadS
MEEKKTGLSEDWLAVLIGLFIFLLSMVAFSGFEVFGWGIKTNVWMDPTKIMSPVSSKVVMPGIVSLILTYVFMAVVLIIGARLMNADVKKFFTGFTLVFFISYACWAAGHYAYIAATPDQLEKFGITWSMNLTGEAGFIIALLAGLFVGNFTPGLAQKMEEAIRPEWYIKTAIVILGAGLGVRGAEAMGLASAVMFSGFCAIIGAYLIFWTLTYFIARKYFKFSREWAAPLASGISICGVSAAIATGGAIRARPIVPIMVSSLVVIFAVVELLVLPFLAQHYLYKEPMVAGAWMGLSVKTDGAAVASGAITDALVRAKAMAAQGINYKDGWVTMAATTVKVFIDMFIGVWAFVLAIIWCSFIECRPGERVRPSEIWSRFPKFVLGYVLTFLILLFVCINNPDLIAPAKGVTAGGNVFRALFFVMTFFTIGVVSNFKKLWEEGIGKLAAIYVLCLFGYIVWIGLGIAWVFFQGIMPPVVAG